ncbi:SDR family NAD(P)-dependent oxidoreductase [Haloplanus aerogenes]|uniref:SDR family NAD(P)-dependent oxidoreductase n=1 Tax=Haloplanus aerogenes TaxID=660522 RepID=UPI001314FFEC
MNVLVTGAASGIGKATTEQLLAHGYDVYAIDIDGDGLADLPDDVETYRADVADDERISQILTEVAVDVVINCAGYYELGAIEDMDAETMRNHFQTNVFGTLNVTHHMMSKSSSWRLGRQTRDSTNGHDGENDHRCEERVGHADGHEQPELFEQRRDRQEVQCGCAADGSEHTSGQRAPVPRRVTTAALWGSSRASTSSRTGGRRVPRNRYRHRRLSRESSR